MHLDAFKTNGSSPPSLAQTPTPVASRGARELGGTGRLTTTVSRGKVMKRTWKWQGHKRVAYIFDVMVDGQRVRRQYASRAEALDELDAFREEAKKPKPPTPPPTLTLAEAFARYFREKVKRSLDEDRRIAKHLKTEFGEQTPLPAITAARVSEFKGKLRAIEKSHRGKKLSAASINRPLALLRHLLRLACDEWEVLPVVPRIKLEKEPEGRLRWLKPEEATGLLVKCREARNTDLADLVEFSFYTGVRQGEALNLTWAGWTAPAASSAWRSRSGFCRSQSVSVGRTVSLLSAYAR